MSINQLIFRSLKKNLKNYYLYVFALVFSASLYFAFVTLQYDPSMDKVSGGIKGEAAIRAASILLIAIVSIFLLYANSLFIKRRSKEIGLFQLIGMTKNRIFRLLSVENFILYFCSVFLGVFVGFAASKLIIMILFKLTGVQAIAALHFTIQPFIQTLIVFGIIYLFIMLMNYLFIKRQTILSLFRVTSSTEGKVKKVSTFEMILGMAGIILILSGYYVSTKLFDGSFTETYSLLTAMLFILGSVIIGTYLFYKGSVSFIFNMIRKRKNGYLNINEVLSLSSIMFRMKSNAILLTIITTVSALAIGLLSLSYISYYTSGKVAKSYIPSDFALAESEDSKKLQDALATKSIEFKENKIEVIWAEVNIKDILESSLADPGFDPNIMNLAIISDRSVKKVDVAPTETIFSGYSDALQSFTSLKDSGKIEIKGQHEIIPQDYLGPKDESLIPRYLTNGGMPVAIVDQTVYDRLKKDIKPDLQQKQSTYYAINLKNKDDVKQANELFESIDFKDKEYSASQYLEWQSIKMNMGLTMFIVGFLGLTFLITSGCILYFKQMDESETEKANYTVLRKLGFTQTDLLKGIQIKQIFNFGIPLFVGLFHSYFAVRSGWFFFGTEIWTPMIIVMVLYTILYSIFGILSVFHYKKAIKDSL